MLNKIKFKNYKLDNDKSVSFDLSYQVFGQKIHSAPVILINHALTGNSNVTGENGWWNSLVDKGKAVDLNKFTVIAFNIPGNAYGNKLIDNYYDFSVLDVAEIFLKGLEHLKIKKLNSILGGSLGGAIAWQMAYLKPDLAENIIPIATDFIASDWIIANCHIQNLILENSKNPLQDARIHAMLCYRTPKSLNLRFKNQKTDNSNEYLVENWLNYHGKALAKRFDIKAYKLMNHLLTTINVCDSIKDLGKIKSNIHMISVNSDCYFTHQRNEETLKSLIKIKSNTFLHTINSIHGHDAFLMEFEQLNKIIENILKSNKK